MICRIPGASLGFEIPRRFGISVDNHVTEGVAISLQVARD